MLFAQCPGPRTNVVLASLTAFFLLSPGRSSAQFYTWSSPTGGSWTDGTNWGIAPGVYPDTGDRVIFSTAGNDSTKVVTLDAGISIRRLIFNSNQTGSVTIAPGVGGSLTLDSIETGQPTLDLQLNSGNHTILADLTLVGPIAHKWNIAAGQTLVVSGNIGGTQGINKLQAGTLLLNGTNTFSGPTTVSAGTLGGSGSISGPVTVALGATISGGVSPSAPSLTLNDGLTLAGRDLVTVFSDTKLGSLVLTSGQANLSGASLELALGPGVNAVDFRAGGPRSFTIVDAGDGQLTGTFATTNFTTAGFAASEWTVVYDNAGGNVVLNFTPVPEPAAVIGVSAIGLLFAWGLRRRRAGGLFAR